MTDILTGCPATEADDDLAQVLAVDLADPRLYATDRPERIWRTMRHAGAPLRMGGMREHWAVTRHHQIRDVLRQTPLLSSEQGMRLGEKATDGAAGRAAGGLSLLVTDDPSHAQMRGILEAAFSPRRVRRLGTSTAGLARRLVEQAAAEPSVDFVTSIAAPLLTTVACDLIGVPHDDRPRVGQLCAAAFSGSGHETANEQIAAHVELLGYCAALIAHKRRHPADDAASGLATATVDGAPLPTAVATMNCHDLILGGNASARYILTSLPVTMLTQAEFWTDLRSGDADLTAATNELLRFEAPVNHIMRTLLGDLEVGGVTMRRGELVSLWLRSGNRDSDVFEQPDKMSLRASRLAHLTFGHGVHHCIAASLARLEIEALLRAIAELVADATLAAPPVRMESNFLRGYRSVPITLRRR